MGHGGDFREESNRKRSTDAATIVMGALANRAEALLPLYTHTFVSQPPALQALSKRTTEQHHPHHHHLQHNQRTHAASLAPATLQPILDAVVNKPSRRVSLVEADAGHEAERDLESTGGEAPHHRKTEDGLGNEQTLRLDERGRRRQGCAHRKRITTCHTHTHHRDASHREWQAAPGLVKSTAKEPQNAHIISLVRMVYM